MPSESTDFISVLQALREASPSPKNSVAEDAIAMHEILGGDARLGRTPTLQEDDWLTWNRGRLVLDGNAPKVDGKTAELELTVRDCDHELIAGILVRFSVATGGGTLSGQTAQVKRTDRDGRVKVSWTLSDPKVPNRVVAESHGYSHNFDVHTK